MGFSTRVPPHCDQQLTAAGEFVSNALLASKAPGAINKAKPATFAARLNAALFKATHHFAQLPSFVEGHNLVQILPAKEKCYQPAVVHNAPITASASLDPPSTYAHVKVVDKGLRHLALACWQAFIQLFDKLHWMIVSKLNEGEHRGIFLAHGYKTQDTHAAVQGNVFDAYLLPVILKNLHRKRFSRCMLREPQLSSFLPKQLTLSILSQSSRVCRTALTDVT